MNELKWTNWSHSFSSYPEQILSPNSEKEIVGIVQDAKKTKSKIKIVGSGHSCSQIAETKSGILISLEKYNSILSFDPKTLTLKVQAGISLKDICVFLKKQCSFGKYGNHRPAVHLWSDKHRNSRNWNQIWSLRPTDYLHRTYYIERGIN